MRTAQKSEVFVPGYTQALREVVESAEAALLEAPYASNMTSYVRALSNGLEERRFEVLDGRKFKNAELVVRARGYVLAVRVARSRVVRSSIEKFSDVPADYRIVVLRDWFRNEFAAGSISGVDSVLTPFLGVIKKPLLRSIRSYKADEPSAKNDENSAIFEEDKPEPVSAVHEVTKNRSNSSKNPRARMGAPTHTRAHADPDPKSLRSDLNPVEGISEVSLASLENTSPMRGIASRPGLRSARPSTREPAKGENYKIDLSRMQEARARLDDQASRLSRQERSRKKRRHAFCRIDWTDLDQSGRPVLSFDPADPRRPKLLKILDKDARDRTHQACVRKLGQEFSRIYERYRTTMAKRMGQPSWSSEFDTEKQRRYCERVGVLCVKLGVTPRQVLEYWHRNIRVYTDGRLTVPPVSFLSSVMAIDTVACSSVAAKAKERPREVRTATDKNPYADLAKFDTRLRRMLEAEGFDTTRFNDRYLLSVQHNAVAIARGHDLLLAPGQFADMIRCAADWYRAQLEGES